MEKTKITKEYIIELFKKEYPLKLSTLKTNIDEAYADIKLIKIIEKLGFSIKECSSIDEGKTNKEYLIENIPPDLVKAYKAIDNKYKSVARSGMSHDEILKSKRKQSQIDYGRATYRVVSADEACELLDEDNHNVDNLRVFVKDDYGRVNFVEWELRTGSNIYAPYRSGSNPITVGDKTYKHVGYIKSINELKLLLHQADKIYWTDEYSHLIADNEKVKTRRDTNASKFKVYYDRGSTIEHKPWATFTAGGLDSEYELVPDTGAHKDPDQGTYTERQLRDTIKELFTDYTNLRKTLTRLEQNKENLDPEFYEKRKSQLTAQLKDIKQQYDDKVREQKQKLDHKVKRVWAQVAASNKFLTDYLKDLEELTNASYHTKKDFETIANTKPNYVVKPSASEIPLDIPTSKPVSRWTREKTEEIAMSLIKERADARNLEKEGRELAVELESSDNKTDLLDEAEEFLKNVEKLDNSIIDRYSKVLVKLQKEADETRKQALKQIKATPQSKFDKYKTEVEDNYGLWDLDHRHPEYGKKELWKEKPKKELSAVDVDSQDSHLTLDPSLNDVVEFVDFN